MMNLNSPRGCPVDAECGTLPGIVMLVEHVYAEHTEGDEAHRWELTERLSRLPAAKPDGPSSTPKAVRNDCAFCGRERTRNDDNHGPQCPYWSFFGETA